jgi:hypothetical protein
MPLQTLHIPVNQENTIKQMSADKTPSDKFTIFHRHVDLAGILE